MSDNKKSDNRKRILGKRTLAILLLVLVLVASIDFMNRFLCIPMTSNQTTVINMHHEPAGSIDVLLLGSSATYSGFASAYAYELYGFTSYPYALAGGTCTMWKPALQDALRTQDPELIVVDAFTGGYDPEEIKHRCNQAYTVMTHTHFSKEKIASARELSASIDGTNTLSYIIPFLRYHNRVPSNLRKLSDRIELERFGTSPLKGIQNISSARKLRQPDESGFSDETLPLDPDTERIIRDFMDYCKSRDIKVLFVKYPSVLSRKHPEELLVNFRANRILEIADEYSFSTLDLQKRFYEIGLDEKKDFYNHGHTNVRGQKKITAFLGDYIQNTLHIAPSELNNDLKAAWDESITYYQAYCDLNEELMQDGKKKELWDSPDLVRKLSERIGKY